MEGDSFMILFMTLFFVVFGLKSLSIPKGTGILVRMGSMFGFWSQPSPETTQSYSFFWPVLLAIALVLIAFGSANPSPMNSPANRSRNTTRDGTLNMLAIFLVVAGMISFYSLFAPKSTAAAPSQSTGFSLPAMFGVLLITGVILIVCVAYVSLSASPAKSSMKMDDGTVFIMAFAGIFALMFWLLKPAKSAPSPTKSVGLISPSFSWVVLLVFILVIVVYGSLMASSAKSSMRMDDGTASMLPIVMLFVVILALGWWLFTPKSAPPPPPRPSKGIGFLASMCLSPVFWVPALAIFIAMNFGGR